MKKEEVVRIGTLMGLKFDVKTNFPDALEKGRVVFDGVNGQRFVIESKWTDDRIFTAFGDALKLYGQRLQKMEIHNVLNINQDF
jgi:hypothetical protein